MSNISSNSSYNTHIHTQTYILGISQLTVRAIWLKFLNTGSIKNLNRSGLPLKTSEKERRLIAHISKKNPFFTARHIGNKFGILFTPPDVCFAIVNYLVE